MFEITYFPTFFGTFLNNLSISFIYAKLKLEGEASQRHSTVITPQNIEILKLDSKILIFPPAAYATLLGSIDCKVTGHGLYGQEPSRWKCTTSVCGVNYNYQQLQQC